MQITSSYTISTAYSQNYQNQAKPSSDEEADQTVLAQKDTTKVDKQQEQKLQNQIQTLKARDQEVRSHEQAHLSAAGGLAMGGASFQFVTGPDGQRYAMGGEVSIDTSGVSGDPAATIRKAETIRRTALAPAQPSGQDYSVANKATAMANQARMEMLKATQAGSDKGALVNVNA
jgi:hypothetical protein